jgi:tetratricopeptide (TPR) repeat protein
MLHKTASLLGATLVCVGALVWLDDRDRAQRLPGRILASAQHASNAIHPKQAVEHWSRAHALSLSSNETSGVIRFTVGYGLATSLESAGMLQAAEHEYRECVKHVNTDDVHALTDTQQLRLAQCLDRLAQFEQDNNKLAQALVLYDRALDVLATPDEVRQASVLLLKRQGHAHAVAGILNNVGTLYAQLGQTQSAEHVSALSEHILSSLVESSPR